MSGAGPAPSWDLLVAVMGAPYSSDATSTMLRWVDATQLDGFMAMVGAALRG